MDAMKNKPTPEQKYAYAEFLQLQEIRNKNKKEQDILVSLTIALLTILVISYISRIYFVEILMFYLAGIILFLLFRNKKYRKDDKLYQNTLKEIKDRFMGNQKD